MASTQGFLPLTDAAFRASDVSFYDRVPGAQILVDNMSAVLAETSRGFRLTNYSRVEPVLNQQLNDALEGKTPPVASLNNASSQARAIGLQR
jgi:multiple sugar transport system substrate-binding protein